MFAGTPDSGVFKSDLPLINWLAANGTGAGALGNSDIESIAVDLGGNIWAGTGAGVWFTSVEDQGISTWTLASTFTTKVDSLLIMSSNTIYAGTAANTIYKTANGGATWNVVLSTASPVTALGRTSGGSSIVLAGTSDGSIYKSADSGGSWVVTQSTTAQVNQFAFDPSSATVYAASNGTGVWKSLDNGSTWINVSSGLSNLRVLGVALDLSSPSTVVAGTAGNGFFITTTGGQ
jgi:photosystem II stability/assembly factor-like uncharacterized protein